MFTGKPSVDYPTFRTRVLDAVADKIGAEAGKRLTNDEYENVVFLIDLADKYGKIKVDIRLKKSGPFRNKRVVIARDDWYDRTPDPDRFAGELIAAYRLLLKGSGSV